MATKEKQTRRAFGEQGVSRWLPALACFARKAGARSVGAETPELDELQASMLRRARRSLCDGEVAVCRASGRAIEIRPEQARSAWRYVCSHSPKSSRDARS